MGNFIEIKDNKNPLGLHLTNGATSMLITVLGLSGSYLARFDIEKKMIVWLLEHDQIYCGRGSVGFYLTEMPWEKNEFIIQRDFMVSIIDNVKNKHNWETLDYEPSQECLSYYLATLREMFLSIEVSDIDFEVVGIWRVDNVPQEDWKQYPLFEKYRMSKDNLCQFPKCEKHNILLTVWGCHACNDC